MKNLGQNDDALTAFQAQKSILDDLLKAGENKKVWKDDWDGANERIAALTQKKAEEFAFSTAQAEQTRLAALVEREPSNRDALAKLADTSRSVADGFKTRGDSAKEIAALEAELKARQQLDRVEPGIAATQDALATTHSRLAQSLRD